MPLPQVIATARRHTSFLHRCLGDAIVADVGKCPHVFHPILSKRSTVSLKDANLQYEVTIMRYRRYILAKDIKQEKENVTIDFRHCQSSTSGRPGALTESSIVDPLLGPNKSTPIVLTLASK